MAGLRSSPDANEKERLLHALPAWFGRLIPDLILITGTFLLYLPVWKAGFIWDDDSHLTNNPCIVGPLGFRSIWTGGEGLYYPLVLSSFWLQHAIWGMHPLPYHLVNVIMHAGCAVILRHLLLELDVSGAWIGAALWAWHPVQAESVVWITELKNTQSGLFFLLSILLFLRSKRSETPGEHRQGLNALYWLSLLCGVLAVLSKSSTVMLPVVIGLCCWWKWRMWSRGDVIRLLPFFLASAGASAWTIWEQKFHSMAIGAAWEQNWGERLIACGNNILFYLEKVVWPHPLIFIYPRWTLRASDPVAHLPLAGAVAVFCVLWFFRKAGGRAPLFAFCYYVVSLFPVLGFFNVYFFRYSFVGDHFQYLASMGPLALAGAGLAGFGSLIRSMPPVEKRTNWIQAAPATGLLIVLCALTWRHARAFVDDETLWRTTLAHNPNCAIACNNLGQILAAKGQLAEAELLYQRGLDSNPDFPELQNNLGNLLAEKGNDEAAIWHYEKAKQSGVDYAEPYYNEGRILFARGSVDESVTQYEAALRIAPRHPRAHYNLAMARLRRGQMEEAIKHFASALEAKPDYPEAENNLANTLVQSGRPEEAIAHFNKCLALDPNSAEAHQNVANLLMQKGRIDEAIEHYKRAQEIKPADASVRGSFATVLLLKGRIEEAVTQYEAVLKLDPQNKSAHANLGAALLKTGQAERAIGHFQIVAQLQPDSVAAHLNLGLALLQAGRDAEARERFQEVVRLSPGFALPEAAQRAMQAAR